MTAIDSSDPRHFVLGWDNREKRKLLAKAVQELRNGVRGLDRVVNEFDDALAALRSRQTAARRALEVTDFETIRCRAARAGHRGAAKGATGHRRGHRRDSPAETATRRRGIPACFADQETQ